VRDEQFGVRPRHSTSFQLARLVERVTRNFGEERLKGAVFVDVAKAFDTVWIDGLLYKLMLLNFPSYIVHKISYVRGRTFEVSVQTVTSSHYGMWDGVAQGELISPVLFSLTSTCSHPCTTSSWPSTQTKRPSKPRVATNAARQLPRTIPQRPSMVVE
jgi:hypothetical protein